MQDFITECKHQAMRINKLLNIDIPLNTELSIALKKIGDEIENLHGELWINLKRIKANKIKNHIAGVNNASN